MSTQSRHPSFSLTKPEISLKQHTQASSIFSQVSINSSRFEEAKLARIDRENDILSKIAKTQARQELNRKLASECLKFRPIKTSTKEN